MLLQEREQAFEKEQERIRIEKEKEVARLRSQQERASDEQAERDALRAKRATEEAEREWRRKEAAEARHKVEVEAMLKAARSQQMQQKEHYLAVEAQRERAEFEKVRTYHSNWVCLHHGYVLHSQANFAGDQRAVFFNTFPNDFSVVCSSNYTRPMAAT